MQAKLNQSLSIRSDKNKLPHLPQKTIYHQQKDSINYLSGEQYRNRMSELEGSIRLLQKKYKQNLKDGFENKIKSFRLQAVMERKVLKATIQQTKKQIIQEQIRQKAKRAQSQKERQYQRIISVEQRRLQKRKRVRNKAEKDKNEVFSKIRQQTQKLLSHNRSTHDKIQEQLKTVDRKKVYFETIRKNQQSRQLEQQKKQCISRIIQNKQILNKLKQQLNQIQTISRNKSYVSGPDPFVTI